jgi:hypothetical protein
MEYLIVGCIGFLAGRLMKGKIEWLDFLITIFYGLLMAVIYLLMGVIKL